MQRFVLLLDKTRQFGRSSVLILSAGRLHPTSTISDNHNLSRA
jgi:hypothetical protein